MISKLLTHWTLAFVTVLLITLFHYNNNYIVETARLKSFDLLQQYDKTIHSKDIAIVEIDEQALEAYGQWPWKRSVLSAIIWQLREAGAGVIVLPILFSEYDRLDGDQELLEAIAGNGVVIAQNGSFTTNKNGVPRGVAKIGDPLPFLFEWEGMLGPIPEFGEYAEGVGVLNTVPEIDGVVRRLPMLMRVGDAVYPALAIEVIRVAVGEPSYQVKSNQGGIDKMRVPGYPVIQTDSNARVWLRWNKTFDTISASEPEKFPQLEGKTVILGISADGINGIIASPKGGQYNYMPAAVSLQNIMDGDTISRPYWAFLLEIGTTFSVGFLIVILGRFAPYWLAGTSLLVLGGGIVYGVHYAWTNYLYLIDGTMPIVAVVIVGLHAVFARFVLEFFEKQAIKKQFAGYASPTVVRMLQENPALIKEGMKKEVSICFSDLRGFTPLGESFGDDVKGLTNIMNGYMDAITQPVLDMDGMIIKYIGDASMHVHNAPIDDPEHPHTAVQCGLEMLNAVEKFNEKLEKDGRPRVGMGAGINTGLGYLGEMGSTQRHSYDVLGDSVSTAARIESKCKEYGCVLLVGEATYNRTKDDFFWLKVDDLAVKGKSVGIGIWTVLDNVKPAWRVAQRKHEEMHQLYRKQKFQEAIEQCQVLHNHFDGKMSGYYDMWIERCEFMKTQPLPSDWNGVFVATTK
jgi:adenylate cyclase